MRRALTFTAAGLAAAMLAQPVSAEGQVHRIEMKGVAFGPAQVTVRAGDTVEWDNSDIFAHTATSKEGGFDVNVLPGRKGSAAMTRPGTLNYTCRYHPNMKGQIIVEP
jgi:plastocyanin